MMRYLIMVLALCCAVESQAIDTKTVTKTKTTTTVHPEHYVVFFCSPSCVPCHVWERTHLNVVRERYRVRIVDTTVETAWNHELQSLPTFWLARKTDRRKLHQWIGPVELSDIEAQSKAVK